MNSHECSRGVGDVLDTQFLIFRSGDSGLFEVDAARKFVIVQLKYVISASEINSNPNVAATVVVPRVSKKLQKKLKQAVFVWQERQNQYQFPPQTQVYPVATDPTIATTSVLIRDWIESWLKKWKVRGLAVTKVKLIDFTQLFGVANCN